VMGLPTRSAGWCYETMGKWEWMAQSCQ